GTACDINRLWIFEIMGSKFWRTLALLSFTVAAGPSPDLGAVRGGLLRRVGLFRSTIRAMKPALGALLDGLPMKPAGMVGSDIPRLPQADITAKSRRLMGVRQPRQQQDAFAIAILMDHRKTGE